MAGDMTQRSWQVLLLGGPSGVGKTSVSYRIAHHFGVGITEVDDFQIILEQMTTPTAYPALHHWRLHPEAMHDPAEKMVEQLIAVGHTMAPALALVIANHRDTQTPLVLEGDFLLPELVAASVPPHASDNDGAVRGIWLYEEDEAQLCQNFLQREPEQGLQTKRAHVSWLYGQWLKAEAERVGALALPARPWDTLMVRLLSALASSDGIADSQ